MASSLILNPAASSERSRDSSRKKKKKKAAREEDRHDQDHSKWKSQAQHQVYSSKLWRALSEVRISPPSPSAPNETPRRGRAVREAADTVLATTAKGRSRWSRAILTNRLKLKFPQHNRQKARATVNSRTKKPRVSVLRLRGKALPTVQKKVRLLGRLVPGCRKQPLPVLLDEVPDYIAALQMQIRVMSALANLIPSSSSSSSSSSGIDSSISPPSST